MNTQVCFQHRTSPYVTLNQYNTLIQSTQLFFIIKTMFLQTLHISTLKGHNHERKYKNIKTTLLKPYIILITLTELSSLQFLLLQFYTVVLKFQSKHSLHYI